MTRQITIDKTETEGFAARIKNRGQSNGTQTVELYKNGVLVTDEASLTLTPDESAYVLEAPTVFSDASLGQTLTMEVVTNNMTRTIEVYIIDIPDSVVDWFERDGLTSPSSDNWGTYTGDTAGATIQTTTVLQGNSSLKVAAGNEITTQRTSAISPSEITVLMQANASGSSGDGNRVIISKNGTRMAFLDLEGDNTAESEVGKSNLGTWSDNTTYKFRLYNIDFTSETYDAELIRVSDSTVVGSASGVTFENSLSDINQIDYQRNSNTSGTTNPMYVDDMRFSPNA